MDEDVPGPSSASVVVSPHKYSTTRVKYRELVNRSSEKLSNSLLIKKQNLLGRTKNQVGNC